MSQIHKLLRENITYRGSQFFSPQIDAVMEVYKDIISGVKEYMQVMQIILTRPECKTEIRKAILQTLQVIPQTAAGYTSHFCKLYFLHKN